MWLYRSHQHEQDLQLLPRDCSSCSGALPTEAGLEPRPGWTRAPRACATVSASWLPRTALCRTKWLCVFCVCCKWWLLHPKMHKWQLPIPRVRCHSEQVGVNASLEVLCFPTQCQVPFSQFCSPFGWQHLPYHCLLLSWIPVCSTYWGLPCARLKKCSMCTGHCTAFLKVNILHLDNWSY